MINLLPPQEKENLLLEKKKTMIVILWFLILFFLLCLILILFLIEIYSQGRVDAQKIISAEAKKEATQSEIKNIREKISSANATLAGLNSFYQKKFYFSDIIQKISELLPSGTYLTNLSIAFYFVEKEDVKEKGIKVSLSGYAPTREILLEFKKNLGGENDFKEVYFPPSSWVKPADIDFLATFEISR